MVKGLVAGGHRGCGGSSSRRVLSTGTHPKRDHDMESKSWRTGKLVPRFDEVSRARQISPSSPKPVLLACWNTGSFTVCVSSCGGLRTLLLAFALLFTVLYVISGHQSGLQGGPKKAPAIH